MYKYACSLLEANLHTYVLQFTLTTVFASFKFTKNTWVTITEHRKSEGNADWTSYTHNSVLPRSISDTEMVYVNCEKLQTCNTWHIYGGSAAVKLLENGKTLHLYSTTHTHTLTGQVAVDLQVHSAAEKYLVKYRWKGEILLSNFVVKKIKTWWQKAKMYVNTRVCE